MTVAQLFVASLSDDFYLAKVITYISVVFCGASALILALISYDRYLHLVKLQNYNVHMTTKRLYTMLFLCWLYPICLGLLTLSNSTISVLQGMLFVSTSIITFIIAICYWKSYKFIKEKSKTIPRKSAAQEDGNENSRNVNHSWKLAKTFAIIIACFVVCWAPMVSLSVYILVQRQANLSLGSFAPYDNTVFYMTVLIGFSNSTINPFIYFWRSRELKGAMKQFVSTVIFRRQFPPSIDPA